MSLLLASDRRFVAATATATATAVVDESGDHHKHHETTTTTTVSTIRLSKRMGELDLCSRREADRLILSGRILVDGNVVEIGEKVAADLSADRIKVCPAAPASGDGGDDDDDATTTNDGSNTVVGASSYAYTEASFPALVLNKPTGYVSGQAEHDNPPAIRLLTSESLWRQQHRETEDSIPQRPSSWKGFAPAGRLDLDSTGVLVFSQSGVLAKKIVGAESSIEKEYVVRVSPAQVPSRREMRLHPQFRLPAPTLDLSALLEGGRILLGDEEKRNARLRPCVKAEWIQSGEILRIVLTEGRKRQIRRACRELLGWHVVALQRTRVGPIHLENMPEGSWRPLRQSEIDELLAS